MRAGWPRCLVSGEEEKSSMAPGWCRRSHKSLIIQYGLYEVAELRKQHEGKHRHFLNPARILFAVLPLAKAGHMAKPSLIGWETRGGYREGKLSLSFSPTKNLPRTACKCPTEIQSQSCQSWKSSTVLGSENSEHSMCCPKSTVNCFANVYTYCCH